MSSRMTFEVEAAARRPALVRAGEEQTVFG